MLVGILGLFVLVSVAVWLPPVQKFAVGKAADLVAAKTGMQLSVERFGVRFPVGISMEGAMLLTPAGDTLAAVGSMKARVALLPLFRGNVRATGISLENAASTYRDSVSSMTVRARLDLLTVRSASLGLKDNSVDVSRVDLSGADVWLDPGRPKSKLRKTDSVSGTPWKFDLRRLDFSDVKFAMNLPVASADSLASTGSLTSADSLAPTGRADLPDNHSASRLAADLAEGTVRGVSLDLAGPLSVKADRVELANSGASYSSPFSPTSAPARAPFDPGNIRVDSLDFAAADFVYNGSDVSATLQRLELTERSGLRIVRGAGGFSMTANGLSLDNFDLATADSEIHATATAGKGVMRAEPSTPVSMNFTASVGPEDIYLFVPVDPSVGRTLQGLVLTVDGDLDGTLDDISIHTLRAEMPRHIAFNVDGNLRSPTEPAKMSGRISFDGELSRMEFVKGFIADTTLRRRIDFPQRMTLHGDAVFSPDVYELDSFTIAADTGRLDAKARLDMRSKEFDADARLEDFPLHSFLPHDSLGVATISLTAHGTGFDPFDGMTAGADVRIDRVDYRGFAWRDVALTASLADSKFAGHLTSSNEALSLDLTIDGVLERDRYEASVKGDVWRADIRRMGFSANALAFETNLDLNGTALRDTAKMRFRLDAKVDSTVVRFGSASQRIPLTTIAASATDSLTTAKVRSGDLAVDLSSPMSMDSIVTGFGSINTEIRRQLAARRLSADSLQKAFPSVNMRVRAGRGNFVHDLARLNDMEFEAISADMATVTGDRFDVEAEIDGFRAVGLTLDTIGVRLQRHGDKLDYSMRLANRPENSESLALLWAHGSAGGNEADLNVLQRNSAGSIGFRFGIVAQYLENSIRASITPQNPILGYEQWTVNDGNHAEYFFDGRLTADMRLQSVHDDGHFNLISASLPDIPQGALRLDAAGIDIGHLVELFPTLPRVGGVVSSDLTFGFRGQEKIIAAKGTLGVADLMYERKRVADVDATVDFQSDGSGRMVLDAGIDIENRTAVTAKGYYTKTDMNFAIAMPAVPLSLAGAFLPPKTAEFSGNLDGRLDIKGAPANPVVTGDLGFTNGKADLLMAGTTYGISTDRLTIAGGALSFNGFGLIAPNNRKMRVDGTVDISDFSNMKADVAVVANNFQAVNSTHLGGSQIYGTAAFDIDVTARGPVNGMTVRGDIDLLRSTDIYYIVRNQSQDVKNEKQNIVDFMVFADSLYTDLHLPDSVATFRRSAVDMLVGMNVEEGLKATLSLDELSENRVVLEGGGDLTFSINSQGDMRLAGRYTLSGGTVYYKPPMISQKIFDVDDGSYVEWTGEPAAPAFNVTGSLTQRVTLDSEGGGAKEVDFRITISISGSLKGIAVTFDVSAPGDIEIQNELSAMSDEARMQQALMLLINNQYTGLAYSSARSGGFNALDQVGKFVSKEINQWARNNLRGVDFSMGIDSKADAVGNNYTDYSYSVSKSLFSDRVKVSIGGSVSDNSTSAQELSQNLVDDITLEYRLTARDNMFLKVYRYNTQESILEGEVTETGGGFVMRKKMNRFRDLFHRTKPKKKKSEN